MKILIKTTTVITILFSLVFGNIINYSYAEENNTNNEDVKTLVLNGVEVVGKNIVELKFATEIEDNEDKDIIVRLLGESPKEIFVSDFNIKGKNVKLTLEEDLESNKEYEVIIFSITGKNGATITSGLDGAIKFNSDDISRFDVAKEDNKDETLKDNEAVPENNIEDNETVQKNNNIENSGSEVKENQNNNQTNSEDNVELESANLSEENNNSEAEIASATEKNNNLSGKNIEKEEMDKHIEIAASNKKELVKTGPESILLIVLSLILTGLVGYTIKTRKVEKVSIK